jgi:hypothetical protein
VDGYSFTHSVFFFDLERKSFEFWTSEQADKQSIIDYMLARRKRRRKQQAIKAKRICYK